MGPIGLRPMRPIFRLLVIASTIRHEVNSIVEAIANNLTVTLIDRPGRLNPSEYFYIWIDLVASTVLF